MKLVLAVAWSVAFSVGAILLLGGAVMERVCSRLARRLAFVSLFLIGAMLGCVHTKPPNPVPTPPPTPPPSVGPVHPEMLLHREGRVLVQADGHPFDFRGAKTCCFSEDGEPNPRWALGGKEINAWLKDKGNINFVSDRPGPWRAFGDYPNPADNDDPWLVEMGGAYLEVGSKADLTQWNPKFWSYNDQVVLDAAALGQQVQVGVIDGWSLKGNCFSGGRPRSQPWHNDSNLQGTNHCQAAQVDAVQDAWVRKVVDVFGRHGNVTWELSNESWLVQGFKPEWEDQIATIIRDEETKKGYQHHLVATNAERDIPAADWNEFHTNGGTVSPTQKITGVNEYNPEPPLSGNTLVANYCSARTFGVYYWAWRHEMSLVEWLKALAGIKAGCTWQSACAHPDFESPGWVTVQQSPAHLAELGAAIGVVRTAHPAWFADENCLAGGGTPPGDDPAHAAERWNFFDTVVGEVANEMRKAAICAWQQRRVEIHSLRPDGFWTELHGFSTGNGCKNGNPYKNTWRQP